MKLVDRIQRKLTYLYYVRRFAIKQRRTITEANVLQEIRAEPARKGFDQPLLIISLDDVCLADGSPGVDDLGGRSPGGVARLFHDFAASHRDACFTLFFIPCPCREQDRFRQEPRTKFGIEPACKSHPLVSALLEGEKGGSIEIAQHGFCHRWPGPRFYYPAFEFEFISTEERAIRIARGYDALASVFDVRGFKPPAWGIGQLLGSYHLTQDLHDFNRFDYVCLSSPTNGLNYAKQQVSHLYPSTVGSLLNIPQNISVLWKQETIAEALSVISGKFGVANIQLHFVEGGPDLLDGLSVRTLDRLDTILKRARQLGFRNILAKEACSKWLP